jgi:cysteine desulfurase
MIFLSEVEHDSILAPARANGAKIVALGATISGRVAVEDMAAHILRGAAVGRALIALQLANNETGVIQDVAAVAAFAREHGLFVHTDAVQAPGRIPVDFASLGVDTLSLSAHKLGGPKGIGALVIRDHLDLVSLIRGGGQERRRRAGTENLAGIAGFGAAAEAAAKELQNASRITKLRDDLETALLEVAPATVVIAEPAIRLGNTIALALPGKLAETLVIRLDLAGIAVSAGSACSSGKVGASHVLEAMGLPRDVATGTIRVSLGPETTKDDIAAFVAAWKEIAANAALAA